MNHFHWLVFAGLFVAALIGSSKFALPLLVVAAVVFFLIAVAQLSLRFPLTMIAICGFLQGLLGGRGRRW
jgi:membrane protein implicated in regulation of membrane protease activity